MLKKQSNGLDVLAYNPLRSIDLNFAHVAKEASAFPIVTFFDSDEISDEVLKQIFNKLGSAFGLFCSGNVKCTATWFEQVEFVLIPFDTTKDIPFPTEKIIYQVTSLNQALAASKINIKGVALKGNEASGEVADDTAFILFQKVIKEIEIPIWIQGGVGVHTSAAYLCAGATGVVLDYQLAFFPEFKLTADEKELYKLLDGSETRVINNQRVFVKPGNQVHDRNNTRKDLNHSGLTSSFDSNVVSLSQDIGLSWYNYKKYKNLRNFVFAIREAQKGHLQQAKKYKSLAAQSPLALELGLEYSIAQGPMSRVSDVPEFAMSVAKNGALPFIALSLQTGDKAKDLLLSTKELCLDRSWGVGILGFIDSEILKAQIKLIEEFKPTVVLIAGGRSKQVQQLEAIGVKTFVHVPSQGLLDIFIKDGLKRFVFEGRECGGHVGPLSSFSLWERQINRLLEEDDLSGVEVFFAGGIHDELSSSMISILAAPIVARGAKIGVLMGTSYLFTKEAVETGAVLKQFQQCITAMDETCLIESSVGHVTRCLKTPFVNYFEDEKRKLQVSCKDYKEVGRQLEALNIGRLRIAAKGLERDGNAITLLNSKEQFEQGLYMIGQVATIRNQIVTIKELHESISVRSIEVLNSLESKEIIQAPAKFEEIAIVGMACVFPEAANLEEYWKNIIQGKDSISEVPDSRWNKSLYYNKDSKNGDKSASKWGGFIPTVDFDPLFFGIPPQSIASIEPVQLLSLKIAYDALKDAGYDKKYFDRETTSVVFGVESGSDLSCGYDIRANLVQYIGEIPAELDALLPRLTEDSFAGVLPNVVAGRIANRLDLGGRNISVDAACGSSLAAVDVACQELQLGNSNMVIVGGADLHNSIGDYLKFSSTQALTPDGKCKTFDQSANGISLGEGVAVIVLKRLHDALVDQDKVYAVIKGVGSSSDGKSLGLTAPRKLGQIRAFERAYSQAGISPSDVGLLEAHGTGTNLGDKTELSAMTEVFLSAGALPAQTTLGSVKTQIGHTKCAAGLAGLIKVALAVQYGVNPPTLNIEKPNSYYKSQNSPFVFNDKATPWIEQSRIAGVSAFGFGGTNFHVVLQNSSSHSVSSVAVDNWSADLVVFRANNEVELKDLLTLVKRLVLANHNVLLKNIAYTLSKQNGKPIKLVVVANSVDDLISKIDLILGNRKSSDVYYSNYIEGKVAFLFSGQGSQRINMARDLFVALPHMRKLLIENREYQKVLFPDRTFEQEVLVEQKEFIKDTRNAQPLLGIIDYSIAKYLISIGIEPDMLAGHSYGEIPALAIAGAISEADLTVVSRFRAESILEAVNEDAGAMVAVNCNWLDLNELLENEDGVSIVNHNSQNQSVIAGFTNDINRVCNKLKGLNKSFKKLEVACAFHSPVIAKSPIIFKDRLKEIKFNQINIPVYSNTTGQLYPIHPELIKDRLCEHLVMPVKFYDEVKEMIAQGAKIFIETGPGNILSKLTQTISQDSVTTLNTEQPSINGIQKLVDTIAQYVACGREIDFEKFFEGRDVSLIDLHNIEKYALGKSIWKIDGHSSTPVNGKLPANAGRWITTPLSSFGGRNNSFDFDHAHETNKRLTEYLTNVQLIVKSQQEIMMSYLGNQNGTSVSSASLAGPCLDQLSHQKIILSSDLVKKETFSALPEVEVVDIKGILLETVCQKTGYPIDMLNMDMDLEADLSIDSIKRLEIVSELKSKLASGSSQSLDDDVIEKLTSIKNLSELVCWFSNNYNLPSQIKNSVTVQSNALPDFKAILLDVVCEKTGYPIEMLDLDMDLESDLSIDSIKRVEIVSKIRDRFKEFNLVDFKDDLIETLSGIKTLNGFLKWMSLNLTNSVSVEATHGVNNQKESISRLSENEIRNVLNTIVSNKTGYPIEMLGIDMDLEGDLSIDSIKRIEIINDIRSHFSLIDGRYADSASVETLSGFKTLKDFMKWIFENVNTQGDSVEKNELAAETLGFCFNESQVTNILLDIVSEKTGYPIDMLGLNMDLESDLSIDSIKRVEIISSLRSKIDFSSHLLKSSDIVDSLSDFKSLKAIIDWIENSVDKSGMESTEEEAAVSLSTSESVDYEEVLRVDFELNKSQLFIENRCSISGKRIAIIDDGGYKSIPLKSYLESKKACVTIVNETDILDQYDGLIALEFFDAPKRLDVISFFNYVQKLNYKEVSWIYVITDIVQILGKPDQIKSIDLLQGFYGFLNSLNKEWNAECKTINLHDRESVQNMGQIVEAELCTSNNNTAVHYINSERHNYELYKSEWDESYPKISLDKDSVVLVLGGAQGITAEIIKELSSDQPCNYVLAGRSPFPTDLSDGILDHEISKIRTSLLANEKFKTPLELEHRIQQIYKRNQILLTKSVLESHGSNVYYYSLDLTNEQHLKQLLDELYLTFGKIDGIIHAIGYLDDKYFHKKTVESFHKVFDTKVAPLKVLHKYIKQETKFCVLFSSIASVMGNKGQVDYAAANSVLDQSASIIDSKIDGRAFAINWGPWKGKGMISESLELDLLKRGITSISLEAGAKAFVKELKYGVGSQIILMTPVNEMALSESQIENRL